MVTQASNRDGGFGLHTRSKAIEARIHPASEHKVLPAQQAQLVAGFVESIALVDAAAPHPQHRAAHRRRFADQLARQCRRYSGGLDVGRNPVGSAAEDRLVVDRKVKAGCTVALNLFTDTQVTDAELELLLV